MLGQIFTHWHCLQHVGTHGFCRGRRVCPTEAIKNHPEKNHPKLERTVYAKYVRSRSNIFKRRNIDQACSANMTCTSRIPVFLFFVAGDLPQSVLLVFWTEGNGSKSVHACHAIRQDFINDCHTILHEGNQQIIPTIRLIFENDGALFFWTVPKARSTSPGTSTRGHHFFGATWCPFGAMLRTFTASCGLRS